MSSEDLAMFCFAHRSRKAAGAVTRAFNQRLKPLNLQITQFILLGAIAREGGRSIAALAEEVGVESSAVLRNLKVLEDRGLVSNAGGRGRTGRRVCVTAAGQALIADGVPAWRRVQADLAALMDGRDDETREALVRLERAALALEKADR
jgi:DNA-binding MarR family transcriptional regulator